MVIETAQSEEHQGQKNRTVRITAWSERQDGQSNVMFRVTVWS